MVSRTTKHAYKKKTKGWLKQIRELRCEEWKTGCSELDALRRQITDVSEPVFKNDYPTKVDEFNSAIDDSDYPKIRDFSDYGKQQAVYFNTIKLIKDTIISWIEMLDMPTQKPRIKRIRKKVGILEDDIEYQD